MSTHDPLQTQLQAIGKIETYTTGVATKQLSAFINSYVNTTGMHPVSAGNHRNAVYQAMSQAVDTIGNRTVYGSEFNDADNGYTLLRDEEVETRGAAAVRREIGDTLSTTITDNINDYLHRVVANQPDQWKCTEEDIDRFTNTVKNEALSKYEASYAATMSFADQGFRPSPYETYKVDKDGPEEYQP